MHFFFNICHKFQFLFPIIKFFPDDSLNLDFIPLKHVKPNLYPLKVSELEYFQT